MRIDSRNIASIVSAWYSPNVDLFCGKGSGTGFSRCVTKKFSVGSIYNKYDRIGTIYFSELFFEIKRK